jgi:hypothetical protein
MLTNWKYDQSKDYSITQRWIATIFISTGVCIWTQPKNLLGLPLLVGRTILTFFGVGFILLPELNTNWIKLIDNL